MRLSFPSLIESDSTKREAINRGARYKKPPAGGFVFAPPERCGTRSLPTRCPGDIGLDARHPLRLPRCHYLVVLLDFTLGGRSRRRDAARDSSVAKAMRAMNNLAWRAKFKRLRPIFTGCH